MESYLVDRTVDVVQTNMFDARPAGGSDESLYQCLPWFEDRGDVVTQSIEVVNSALLIGENIAFEFSRYTMINIFRVAVRNMALLIILEEENEIR